jgi:hypothetical protein
MGHGWLVYELKRDDGRVYCSSFAVVAVLLDIGWKLSDWGVWDQIRLRERGSAAGSTGDHGSASIEQAN